MNEILGLLSGGDLRSDGRANEAADQVIENPTLILDLVAGLGEPDDVVRARAAHALERVSRSHPEMMRPYLGQLIEMAEKDAVPMVRWHLAMIFGNLAVFKEEAGSLTTALYHLLEDGSVFVQSWAIVSLCILGRRDRGRGEEILRRIKAHQNDRSTAIRSKVIKAIRLLEDEHVPMPAGWVKRVSRDV